MARRIAVQVTDPAGTTEGGIDRIDLTRTYGHTRRSLDLTHTPIRPPLPTPASLSRMSGDSESFDHQPIALGQAMSGHAK